MQSDTSRPYAVAIPLRDSQGGIRAFTLIDPEDVHLLGRYPWCLSSHGYAAQQFNINAERQRRILHRVILGLSKGDGWSVDHISGCRLDNRRVNLRRVTHAQNMQNFHRITAVGNSRYRGVHRLRRTGRWEAYLTKNAKKIHLGYYGSEEEANLAAAAGRAVHFPYSVPGR